MWLVHLALRNPYTVYVGMLLVGLLGVISYQRTPTDILPQIKMPVVVVFASYRGMPAPDMEKSVTAVLERALTRCDHLEHIESKSLLGIGIIRVFFRPQVEPDVAASQVISLVNSEMQNMPPGMLPPSILKYDASAIPVGNLIISSNSRGDKELLDIADHQLREELASVEGLGSAPVFGGVFRQVQIFVHPRMLEALRLSPMDVARIVNSQSQVIPTGEMRIGDQTYYVSSNSMVGTPPEFEKIPLWSDGRKVVYLGDVANVVDATRWRTNTVHVDGRRAVYMPLLRQAGASAVAVVDRVKEFLPELHKRGVIPPDVNVEITFDQSQYVRDALANLRLEGLLGAVLSCLVVLLFLGSLRCTWNIMLAIPLSVLAAFLGLYLLGHTLNIMTLGGLALILGRVVDDSIVDVENTVRHLSMGKTPLQAAQDSAAEIATPVLMATITTVVVFLPLTFMSGIGKYLFTPLAISATLAMAASYLVARTVSPLYNSRFLRPHHEHEHFPRWLLVAALLAALLGLGPALLAHAALTASFLPETLGHALAWPFEMLPLGLQRVLVGVGGLGAFLTVLALVFYVAPAFNRWFERLAAAYEHALGWCLQRRAALLGLVALAIVPGVLSFTRVGQELFPEVDSSEFTVHLRAKGGPRVEATEDKVRQIDELVRTIIPPEDLELTLANIGVSSRWSAIYTSNNGPHAAFLRVQLRSGFHGRTTPTLAYVAKLNHKLEELFPGDDFFFETGGMIRRILNAGSLAPIELQVHGRDMDSRRAVANALDKRISRIPLVKDTYLPQGMDLPQLKVEVDRTSAARLQVTQSDCVRNVIAALMSSAQLAPNFWIDPVSGNPYVIGVQYREHIVDSLQTLENIPLTSEKTKGMKRIPLLRDVAKIERTQAPVEVFHYNADRVSQVFVSVADSNLARVAAEIDRIVEQLPLHYALTKIPPESLLAYAVKVFPPDKGNPAEDAELMQLLRSYFQDEDPDLAEVLRENYGVEPRHLHLGQNADFRARLAAYLQKSNREPARAEIQRDWGVDPLPLRLPPGVRVTVHGEVASMRESFGQMGFNLALAVLLVYLVMAAQFSSWLDPLIMIVAAPLGLIGVGIILYGTRTSLNVQSLMGIMLMIGISVSNSVLLVEFANRLRDEGQSTLDAIRQAARTRLRPILMTTVVTIVGLAPMAIHLHPGDEMNLPLARAVIGGLTGSTLLTLFVVPVLYTFLKPARGAATHYLK